VIRKEVIASEQSEEEGNFFPGNQHLGLSITHSMFADECKTESCTLDISNLHQRLNARVPATSFVASGILQENKRRRHP